mmetsp:Transcript_13965/g.43763  ORF Transcript_13965/g.43763 Transcript_13965/m.43763 type:complete len:273 (+) Transcript_13965:1389-2207(+)
MRQRVTRRRFERGIAALGRAMRECHHGAHQTLPCSRRRGARGAARGSGDYGRQYHIASFGARTALDQRKQRLGHVSAACFGRRAVGDARQQLNAVQAFQQVPAGADAGLDDTKRARGPECFAPARRHLAARHGRAERAHARSRARRPAHRQRHQRRAVAQQVRQELTFACGSHGNQRCLAVFRLLRVAALDQRAHGCWKALGIRLAELRAVSREVCPDRLEGQPAKALPRAARPATSCEDHTRTLKQCAGRGSILAQHRGASVGAHKLVEPP